MDPSYMQNMIQALMGGASLPASMTGQNPTSAYGQGFLTGNMMMPAGGFGSNTAAMGANAAATAGSGSNGGTGGLNSANSLMNGASQQLSQPTSTMSY